MFFSCLCFVCFIHHPRTAWYIISRASVCLSFESLDVGRSFSHISTGYGSSSYMKVIEWGSRSVMIQNPYSRAMYSKTSTGNNSGSIKHRAAKFACSMGFLAIADQMVCTPSFSRDWKWSRVTKYTHLRVVGLRLQGSLVFYLFFYLSDCTVRMLWA